MTMEEWEEEDAELFTSLHLIYSPLHLRSELPFQNRGEIKRLDERTRGRLGDCTHRPPKSCIPNRANTTVKRKRRKRRLMMDFMELMRDTTRFLREAQYLAKGHQISTRRQSTVQDAVRCFPQTHLVILKILRSLSALRTLIPNDIPGLKKPQTTSKMLPTMTYKHSIRGRENEMWIHLGLAAS